jgi:glycine dehydrogenase subunit 1
MCIRLTKKNKFIIPHNISWDKKCVLKNYGKGPEIEIIEIDFDKKTGKIDINELEKKIDKNTAGIYIENPNFFGIFEDEIEKIADIIKESNSLFVVGIDPISIGITKNPGEYGADIVIGEGRALGNPMDFGGSTLGIFACKLIFLRQMPGRIIGRTTDNEGKQAFCMALQTREQHIRRGRATSNICTNEGLNALNACAYLSWLGSNGLVNLSSKNFKLGQILSNKITSIEGFEKVFTGAHFNEFVIKCPIDPVKINKRLLEKNIQGGLVLDEQYYNLKNCMLLGITELYSEEDIDVFISALQEVL